MATTAAATAPSTRCPRDAFAKKLLALDAVLRPTRRRTGVRLVLAAVALCVVLWILEADVLERLVTTAHAHWPLRTASEQQQHHQYQYVQQQHLRSSNSNNNTSACVAIRENHVEREYFRADLCLTRTDIQRILVGLVWTLANVFERNNIPYWLDSGTLLGAVREKTVIPYDIDADVGITKASYRHLRDRELVGIPLAYELQVYKGKFHRQGSRDKALPSRFVHKDSGLYVDIFVFLPSKTRATHFGPLPSLCFMGCYRCRKLADGRTAFKIPTAWVFPLQQCTFGGRNVSCPAQSEQYLEYLYGPEFMTPRQY